MTRKMTARQETLLISEACNADRRAVHVYLGDTSPADLVAQKILVRAVDNVITVSFLK